ncbi:MAG: hypothetical protein OXO52_00415 [Rhodospirillales bacterium]|nr:hypothetical protein [Rhodospirillales bacterium]MDE0382056.1 hypothetical protein [Rhodospirillales bacterium]
MAQARPPDHLCGLGYSPADPRQSQAEGGVCRHAERLLNMVHAYCEIRDSWTGWLRGAAMSRTLFERIIPEMRDLQGAERRVADQPSVTLLAVLDYAARARQTVPTHTPRKRIDYPQPALPDEVRDACERMTLEAEEAERAARRAAAREYAARMADAIQREREEEARRQNAMAEAGVTETPDEARRASARVEARIAVYENEIRRVYEEAALGPDGKPVERADNEDEAAPRAEDTGHRVVWKVRARRWGRTILTPTAETAPRFAARLVLIDRGKRGGTLRAFGEPALDGLRQTINGVAIRLAHRRRDRYEAPLTPAQVQGMRA